LKLNLKTLTHFKGFLTFRLERIDGDFSESSFSTGNKALILGSVNMGKMELKGTKT